MTIAYIIGMPLHPLYHCWYNMLDRCYDKTNKQWADYGGRGITVCDEWRGPGGLAQFVADMVACPPGIRSTGSTTMDLIARRIAVGQPVASSSAIVVIHASCRTMADQERSPTGRNGWAYPAGQSGIG
jgi:hypothetical protein